MSSTDPNHPATYDPIRTDAVNHLVARSVRSIALVATLLYIIFAVAHPVMLDGSAGFIMGGIALASAMGLATIGWAWRPERHTHRANLALGTMALIVLANCTAHMAFEQIPENTANYIAYTLAAGILVLSRGWFYSLLVLGVASWAANVWLLGLVNDLNDWGWRLLIACFISLAVHLQRRYSSQTLGRLNLVLGRQAASLTELVRAPELGQAEANGMFGRIIATASVDLAVQRAGIWLFNSEQNAIHCDAFVERDAKADFTGTTIHYEDAVEYFEALRANRVIDAHAARTDHRTRCLADYLQANDIHSMLDVPILVRGQLRGVICLEHTGSAREWQLHEQNYAASLADIAALAIQAEENAELERRSIQAERLESLGVLAGGVARDFDNLLDVILGHAEALVKTAREDEARASAEAVLNASTRARDLVHQMLAYSGQATFATETMEFTQLVREMDEPWFRDILGSTALELAIDDELLPVHMNATQVRQVLINLVTNARDAKATRLLIKTSRLPGKVVRPEGGHFFGELSPERDYACLSAEDDGEGMDAEVLRHIFDPFYSTRPQGDGLGLPTVLGITRAHQGAVQVESRPGVGTRFRVYLPLDAGPAPAAGADTGVASRLPMPADGDRVLVVEDEPLIVQLIRSMLGDAFSDVDAYETYGEAVDALETQDLSSYAVALIDLSLGDGTGVQLVTRLHEKRPGLPAVLMSGYDASEALTQLPPESSVQFLHKPFNRNQLLEAIALSTGRD